MLSGMTAVAYASNVAEMRIRSIPEDLYKRLRILCIEEDKTLNAKMIDLIREAVAKRKPSG
jgi:plasmid stability protein